MAEHISMVFEHKEEELTDLDSPTNTDESADVSKPTEHQRREWSDAECVHLMQLWRENEVIYNPEHPKYYMQAERKLALDSIAAELGINSKDVHDKMHSLRTYYGSQRLRVEAKMCANIAYTSPWRYYEHMDFLHDSLANRAHKYTRRSRKEKQPAKQQNIQEKIVEISSQDSAVSSQSNQKEFNHVTKTKPVDLKRARSYDHHADAGETGESSEDRLFGDMVTKSLARFQDEQQKELLKLEIQTLIYNARFGKN